MYVTVKASKSELAWTAGKLRLVDSTGSSPNVGLLQIRTSTDEFGTVCGMNLGAADVVCRQLGYDFGSVGQHAPLMVGHMFVETPACQWP